MEHVNGSSSVATTTTTTTTSSSSTSVSASSTAVVLHAEPAAAAAATAATAAMKQQQQQPPRRRSLVPQGWEDQVRALSIAEHKEAGLSLAQAFARDDLAQWLVDAEGGGEVGDEAVEHGDPGQGADEHNEVQSSVRDVAPVRRHNIAYQCRRQQYPKELHQAQDRLHELHGLTVTVLPEVAGKCCGRYTTLCWQ